MYPVALIILMLISFGLNALWVAAAAALVYSARYNVVVFIPLALLLDGYYGMFYHVPYLSLMAIGWYILVVNGRDRLRLSQRKLL